MMRRVFKTDTTHRFGFTGYFELTEIACGRPHEAVMFQVRRRWALVQRRSCRTAGKSLMPDPRPIGMLDSGIGGLSVLREVRRLLPYEPILYVADEGHLPYGPRSRDEIRGFVSGIIQFLIQQDCKLIVIPCNTANAVAPEYGGAPVASSHKMHPSA